MKRSTKTIFLLILYPFIAAAFCLLFEFNSFMSVIVFLVVPSVYFSLGIKRSVPKIIVFAIPLSLLLFIPIDYIAHTTGQWFLIDTMFPRIFGIVPIEDVIWAFFSIYFVIALYEYFLDSRRNTQIWHARMKYCYIVCSCIFILFLLLYTLYPSALVIPFFYAWIGTVVLAIPLGLELLRRPRLFARMTVLGAYFFLFSFIYELVGLKLEWWNFPSTQFFGWVEVVGLRFPLEEFISWFVLFAACIVAYYEFLDDDEK